MLRLSLVAAGRGYSLVAAYGLLIAVASLVEQEPWGSQSSAVSAPGLQSTVSVDVVHGFSMWDPPGTRDRTLVSCIGRRILYP